MATFQLNAKTCIFCFFSMVFIYRYALADDIFRLVTFEQPPYSSLSDAQDPGSATALVYSAFERAGIPFRPEVLPLPRAIEEAARGERTFIFPLLRSDDRESRLQWVAEILGDYEVSGVFVCNGEPPHTMDDARKLPSIAVRNRSAWHEFLIKDEFTNLVRLRNEGTSVGLMLISRHIDCWFTESQMAHSVTAELNNRMLLVSQPMATFRAYIAASSDVPHEVINRLRDALVPADNISNMEGGLP